MTATSVSPAARVSPKQAQAAREFPAWTAWERVLFRVGALFVLQLTIPVQPRFYHRIFPIHSLRDFYSIVGANSGIQYISPIGESGRWGIGSFMNWGVALVIAILGAAIWTWLARKSKRKEYTVANYWLRLFIRYWVALNILHYAYIKIYPAQMPYPSLSNLHTLLGEIAPYRYYWSIIGLSTWYEVVLGCMEAIAGSLLFFRRTTAIGALLNFGLLANVGYANFAYDGGVHVLSVEIALLSGFLLVPYLPNLYRLLVKKEDVVPEYYHPEFRVPWQRYTFTAFKYAAWILFIPLYLYGDIHHYLYTNQSKEPRAPGLTNAQGFYAVTDFKLNGKDIPYSPLDPVRWQNVIFENYPTLTYKVHKALPIRLENGGQGIVDAKKTYELAGFAGGRTYMAYDFDEAKQTLTVQDKNANAATRNPNGMFRTVGLFDPLLSRIVNSRAEPGESTDGSAGSQSQAAKAAPANGSGRGNKKHHVQELVWHYSRPSASRIILTGVTPDKQEFYAVLDRIDENQAIHIGSPVPGQPLVYSRQFGRRYPVTDRSFDGKTDSPMREE